jgi:hypothetical protein
MDDPKSLRVKKMAGAFWVASVVRQSAVIVAHTGMNAYSTQNNDSNRVHKFMPAAQWSRHSCLHFKCRGLAFDGSNFHGSIVSRKLISNCAKKKRHLYFQSAVTP